jgi:hypothetical protein
MEVSDEGERALTADAADFYFEATEIRRLLSLVGEGGGADEAEDTWWRGLVAHDVYDACRDARWPTPEDFPGAEDVPSGGLYEVLRGLRELGVPEDVLIAVTPTKEAFAGRLVWSGAEFAAGLRWLSTPSAPEAPES